ncbi:MAG: lysophospholipid acyltransferase family protein [Bacteroidales bacterium]|nr:lysophospholipid acyltransferase family protein [Bacteroidales bacterium]
MNFLLQSLASLLALLPLKLHYALSRLLAFLAEKIFRYRVGVVKQNLSCSFPGKEAKEIKQIQHRFYRHLADVIAETIWFGGCRKPERLRRSHLVEMVNPEEINRLYSIAPSVMVLMSHAGNWELIGGIGSYDYTGNPTCVQEDTFCVVYLKQSTPGWDEFLKRNRTAPLLDSEGYPGYLESRQVVRYVFEHKDDKKIYNFITDQHPYFKAKDFLRVTFLHRECESMKGAAELARRFGMAVCYMSMPVESRGHYKIKYIPICENASERSADDIMREFYRLLEADIEAQPWNYLWTHNRWKKFPN